MAITASYTPTPKLLFLVSRTIQHTSRAIWFFYGFFTVLPLMSILVFWLIGQSIKSPTYLGLPFWACMTMIAGLSPAIFAGLSFYQIRSNYRTNPSAQMEQNFTITETGIEISGSDANIKLNWSSITKVMETRAYLLFFISRNCVYFVPINLLRSDEVEQIKDWYGSAA